MAGEAEPAPTGSPASMEEIWREIAAARLARPETAIERIEAFPSVQVLHIRSLAGRAKIGPWPPIAGCLGVLFTSRSGSTYLARELECAFAIGRLRETLNSHRIMGRTPTDIVGTGANDWFSFKAGVNGIVTGELRGFFDAYLAKTSFILLVRRDIVAQAVSVVKATQTRRWHSNQKSKGIARYDGTEIAKYVAVIADGVEKLRLYIERAGRPWRALVYEDFADGDFAKAYEACDGLGVPRRGLDRTLRPMPVKRIGDTTNQAWRARFKEEIDSALKDRIDRYLADI